MVYYFPTQFNESRFCYFLRIFTVFNYCYDKAKIINVVQYYQIEKFKLMLSVNVTLPSHNLTCFIVQNTTNKAVQVYFVVLLELCTNFGIVSLAGLTNHMKDFMISYERELF